MMPGTCSPGEMQQAMNLGCEAIKFFPGRGQRRRCDAQEHRRRAQDRKWMCTGGINAKNVNDYLAYDQIFAVGGTWMCKSDKIKAGAWDEITAMCKEAVDTMLGPRARPYRHQLGR